jgi:hypothetical protein
MWEDDPAIRRNLDELHILQVKKESLRMVDS